MEFWCVRRMCDTTYYIYIYIRDIVLVEPITNYVQLLWHLETYWKLEKNVKTTQGNKTYFEVFYNSPLSNLYKSMIHTSSYGNPRSRAPNHRSELRAHQICHHASPLSYHLLHTPPWRPSATTVVGTVASDLGRRRVRRYRRWHRREQQERGFRASTYMPLQASLIGSLETTFK
jgi:hypothetical protein